MDPLRINSHLKFIEFLLATIDSADDFTTIADIKRKFSEKFGTPPPPLLSQEFGLVRLIPLMLIREELKKRGSPYDHTISIIRHAFAHGNIECSEIGYEFKSDTGTCTMSYANFNEFIWWVENAFYNNRQLSIPNYQLKKII